MSQPTLAQVESGGHGPGGAQSVPKLLFEVRNWHFTTGLKIPSIYLRVYTDGLVECHTLHYSGEEDDVTKSKTLTPHGLDRVRGLISEARLSTVKGRYELTSTVMDSWMEWDINVPRGHHVQHIELAHRSGGFALWPEESYPPALFELGCFIWNLRNEVYSDAPPYRGCDKYPISK